jgi:hypothetical protein
MNMFHPVLGGLNKLVEEAIPRFLNETFEPYILLLVDYMYKQTPLAAPEKSRLILLRAS